MSFDILVAIVGLIAGVVSAAVASGDLLRSLRSRGESEKREREVEEIIREMEDLPKKVEALPKTPLLLAFEEIEDSDLAEVAWTRGEELLRVLTIYADTLEASKSNPPAT